MTNKRSGTDTEITRTLTGRPVAPGAEAHLGVVHPILDHGMIRLVDYMGDDAAICQAARTSYGTGTKSVSQDEALIRYLMRHWHTTPFEMCLAGDTRIPTFPCRGAKNKFYTIRELAEAFERGGRENSWAKIVRIRTVNPETGIVTSTKIKRAWKTGFMKVFRLKTEAPFNRSITLTDNHPVLTPSGFKTLKEGLSVGDLVMHNGIPALSHEVVSEISRRRSAGQTLSQVSSALGVSAGVVQKYAPGRVARKTGFFKKDIGSHKYPRAIAIRLHQIDTCSVKGCEKPARDRHHVDENPHNNFDRSNIVGLCPKHHRHMHTMSRLEKAAPAKIVSIEYVGIEPVYDIEVYDDNHTFVAEGIVVHNCEIKLHVKLPVFVARQWIRHRTASVNEYSARYSILDREFYIPEPEHLAAQSAVNNQGRGAVLEGPEAARVLEILKSDATRAYDNYEAMMSTEGQQGLARELARMNLPANIYTQWYWKTNLHNLFNFMRLRADPHAQYEIRVYAEQIAKITRDWVPMAYRAFEDYRLEGSQLSKMELELLRDMLKPRPSNLMRFLTGWRNLDTEGSRMSGREIAEFRKKLGL